MGPNATRCGDGLLCAKSLREYGALVGKIDRCIEDMNTSGTR